MADRIQELLTHIEVREEEIKSKETQLRERISNLEVDKFRLEQENQEQECLITELTKKTEDDLNTIMELQQNLAGDERHVDTSQLVKELCVSQLQSDKVELSGCFLRTNLEQVVESVQKGVEPQLMSSQCSDSSATASAPGCQQENHCNPLQNSLQSSLHVNSLTAQVGELTKLVQSLKIEQEELLDNISSLREQQTEVALSVQTQTEVKQQLTRTVWGLKEEKDNVSRSLDGLKQEREQITKTVRGLKDERDQFIRSGSCLTEEKEQITNALFGLKIEKEKLLESISSRKLERDQILCLLQSLQREKDQLSQAVFSLKQEKDELSNSLKCLMQQRDKESYTVEEDSDKLMKLVSTLREEEEQIKLLQGLREERKSHKAALCRAEGRNLLNPNSAVSTKTLVGTEEHVTQRCLNDRGISVQVLRDTYPLSIMFYYVG